MPDLIVHPDRSPVDEEPERPLLPTIQSSIGDRGLVTESKPSENRFTEERKASSPTAEPSAYDADADQAPSASASDDDKTPRPRRSRAPTPPSYQPARDTSPGGWPHGLLERPTPPPAYSKASLPARPRFVAPGLSELVVRPGLGMKRERLEVRRRQEELEREIPGLRRDGSEVRYDCESGNENEKKEKEGSKQREVEDEELFAEECEERTEY